jgi:IQ calmodulin-binding motif
LLFNIKFGFFVSPSFRFLHTDLNEAVTKIQACFRGSQVRKAASGSDAKEVAKVEDVPEEALDIDMEDPELHKAASKIQATFRGHKVRKRADDN